MTEAKELREAIEYYEMRFKEIEGTTSDHKLAMSKALLEGAKLGLATLPREVEVDGWVLVEPDTGVRGGYIFSSEELAQRANQQTPSWVAVRLTGKAVLTATLPGRK